MSAPEDLPAPPPATPRDNMDQTASFKYSDIEAILAEKHGERFRSYRIDYRKSLNYDKNGFLPDFPITVTFELVNRCNLACIMCYTINHHEKKYTLSLETFRKVMDECEAHGLPALVIGLGAEPLLHKPIREILKSVQEAKVMDSFLGTNGVLLTEDLSDFIVTHDVSRVEISLDAATPETYKIIRGKDELLKIEKNIYGLLEAKKRHNSKTPVIRLCFCLQKENAHEREAFLKKWSGVVDYVDVQQKQDFSYVEELRKTGDVPEEVKRIGGKLPEPYCAYPFNSLNVWSNGDVSPCCNFYAKSGLVAGNIHFNTLKEIWDGKYMKDLRQEFHDNKLNPICLTCLAQRDGEFFQDVKKKTTSADPAPAPKAVPAAK